MFPLLSACLTSAITRQYDRELPTQVIHAPLSLPKAICHAGSSDWKNSSGWKKVLILSAFRILNAIKNRRTSCAVVAVCARSNVRLRKLLESSNTIDESLPTLVEDSEVGVDDIAPKSRRNHHVLAVKTKQLSEAGPQGATREH